MDWTRWPNFSESEFRCSHTGKCRMHAGFLDRLQKLRTAYGKPLTVTSGYRDETHPIEARKSAPGAHNTGRAADLAVSRGDAYEVLRLALELGFTGIGVAQKGDGRFIHLDDLPAGDGHLRPTVWSY